MNHTYLFNNIWESINEQQWNFKLKFIFSLVFDLNEQQVLPTRHLLTLFVLKYYFSLISITSITNITKRE